MLDGALESLDGPVTVLAGHTFMRLPRERGLTFIDKTKRGNNLAAGEQIGYVKHPFTGDICGASGGPGRG